MTTYTPTTWARALLATIGAPVTDANVQAVTAWEAAEGGNWHNTASYNPLNTTLREPGSHGVNSAGVQAYTSWDQGLQATADTLAAGRYANIRAALASGNDAQGVADAILASPWGTQSLSLGSGAVGGGTGAPGATQAASVVPGTTGLTGLLMTALFVAGGVALLVLGVGKLTGTHPVSAAATAAAPETRFLRR